MGENEESFLEVAAMELARHKAELLLAPNMAPVPPDDLWDFARQRLDLSGCNPVFWFTKDLTATDVNPYKNRLLCRKIETVEVLLEALTTSEENLVRDRNRKLQVVVIHQRDPPYDMELTYWRSSGEFALIGSWTNLVQTNGWENGTPVSIWFFRYGVDRRLGFLITSQ